MSGAGEWGPDEQRRRRRENVAIGGAVVILLTVAVIVVLLFLSSISFKSCDIDLTTDRSDCAGSPSPLIRATVTKGGHDVVTLLTKGMDPNARDHFGNRAVPCAALMGNAEAVSALLDKGGSALMTGYAGGRPIVAAVSGEGREGNDASDDPGTYFVPIGGPARE